MIQKLIKRGSHLKHAKFDKVSKIERSIQDYKEKNIEQLVVPTRAIVLFEYEKTKFKLLKPEWSHGFEFCGHKLQMAQAEHPTTILWENDASTKCK